jgi:hypothetical protein
MRIKTTMKYYFKLTYMAQNTKTERQKINVGEDIKKLEQTDLNCLNMTMAILKKKKHS